MLKNILLYVVPLTVVLLLGVVLLPHPFHGDQALFMHGAIELDHGSRLYVDFWDAKQPGIFVFYWIAGTLFGFSEVGVHSLELILYCLFSVLIVFSLKDYFHFPWMSSLVPIATIGSYYCIISKPQHLTQIEILVSFPLFLIAWLSSIRGERNSWQMFRWFVSGVCAGIVVFFKLVLAPVPIMMWIVVIVIRLYFENASTRKVLMLSIFSAISGGGITLLSIVLWFAFQNSLSELIYVTFLYPFQLFVDAPMSYTWRLLQSTWWLVYGMGLFIMLAIISIIRSMIKIRAIEFDILTFQMIGWIITGLLVILIQRVSYWEYHFLLLIFPIGFLAVRGIDLILLKYSVIRTSSGSFVNPILLASCLLILSFYSIFPRWGITAAIFAKELLKRSSWNLTYQVNTDSEYRRIYRSSKHVRDETSNEPIYVFGDPLNYLITNRQQAIPESGWSWEVYTEKQWFGLISKLDQSKPSHIYFSKFYRKLIPKKLPIIKEYLNQNYIEYPQSPPPPETPRVEIEKGIWYKLKEE